MLHLPKARVVLGVSGGLDSTLALILAIEACDRLQRSRKDVLAVTMPGSGTTDRTRLNAERLISELVVELYCAPLKVFRPPWTASCRALGDHR